MRGPGYAPYTPALGGPNNSLMYANGHTKPPCHSLEDLINAIRADIEASEKSSVPECTTSEVSLSFSAWVPLHRPNIGPYAEGGEQDLPAEFKTSWIASGKDGMKQHPQASVQAIISAPDQLARQTVQRAASRGIVAAIEKMDGFKYTFNNAWAAKDDHGMRYSYICQDSTQNKDRHANGFTRTQKHLKGEGERGPRKPTFDCKGSVSVKCSLQRGCVDVYYRHYAIHPKVKERKTVRRPSQSRRQDSQAAGPHLARGEISEETGGLAGVLQEQTQTYTYTAARKLSSIAPPRPQAMAEVNTQQASNIGKPLKRKRDSDMSVQSRVPGKTLSLAELLKQSETAKPQRSTPPKAPKATQTARPPPLNYDLPSWQMPPAPPVRPRPPSSKQSGQQPPNLPPSYQPPYQPTPPRTQPGSRQTSTQYPPTPPQPPRPPQQKYSSVPKGLPQNQGLFTTMKAVPRHSAPQVPVYPGFVAAPPPHPSQLSGKASCTNCRYGQKEVSPKPFHAYFGVTDGV